MTAARLRRLWRGFVALFGLDACPVPTAPAHPETAQQRARCARLAGLLRPSPPASGQLPVAERRERHEKPGNLT